MKLRRRTSHLPKSKHFIVTTALVIGVIGTISVVFTLAEGDYITFDPTQGTHSNVVVEQDASAHGGMHVTFGSTADPVWAVDLNFNANDLSTEQQQWHAEVINLMNNNNNNWAGDPDLLFGPANLSYCSSGHSQTGQGSYNYGRAGQTYYRALSTAFAETRDPAILSHMYDLSQTLMANLQDHDGRGYEFFYYTRDNSFCGNDTIALDEFLAHSLLGHIARIFDANRTIDADYATLADSIVAYLDITWVPKWLARMDPSTYPEPAPGSNLVVNRWLDRTSDDPGLTHFIRGLAHPDMGTLEFFYNLGYLTGKSAYTDHANAHCSYYKATGLDYIATNDSYAWRHAPFDPYNPGGNPANPFQETRDYAHVWLNFVPTMHREGWCFSDQDMQRLGNTYYSNNSTHDVYEPGDTDLMAEDVEGGNDSHNDDTFQYTGILGKAKFRMLTAAYLCAWDETGTIKALATTAANQDIVDQRFPTANKTSPTMAAGLLTCS